MSANEGQLTILEFLFNEYVNERPRDSADVVCDTMFADGVRKHRVLVLRQMSPCHIKCMKSVKFDTFIHFTVSLPQVSSVFFVVPEIGLRVMRSTAFYVGVRFCLHNI